MIRSKHNQRCNLQMSRTANKVVRIKTSVWLPVPDMTKVVYFELYEVNINDTGRRLYSDDMYDRVSTLVAMMELQDVENESRSPVRATLSGMGMTLDLFSLPYEPNADTRIVPDMHQLNPDVARLIAENAAAEPRLIAEALAARLVEGEANAQRFARLAAEAAGLPWPPR